MTAQEIVDGRMCFAVTRWVSGQRGLSIGDTLIPLRVEGHHSVLFQCQRTGRSIGTGENREPLRWDERTVNAYLHPLPPQPNHTPMRRPRDVTPTG